MAVIRIYGSTGQMECKPFGINSVDVIPEAIAEEEQIINSSVSETDKTESTEVGEQTGN